MGWINLVGIYGLAGLFLIIGYLFYDKNQNTSYLLLLIGALLIIAIIISDISLKHQHQEARIRGWLD